MDRKAYQDLTHLTDAERAALAERMRIASRNSKGPKGERRREKRWDFVQADIGTFVEHPGGGISRFLVWSRDLSAGGMAFIHGGFLHVGTRCRFALSALDHQKVGVTGIVTSCKLVEGRLHSISVKFEQRIDPSIFIADYVADPTPPPVPVNPAKAEPIYTSLTGKEGDAEHVNKYVTDAHASAKRLAESLTANDLAVIKDVCNRIKGSAGSSGFAPMATIAAESLALLDAGKSITDAAAQLQQLRDMCERAAMRPTENGDKKDDGGKKGHPPKTGH